MRSIAVVILAALLAAFGAACMGDDDDERSRRPAILIEPPPPPPPPPASAAPAGWKNVYQFRGSATNLWQPPGGQRVAIAGTLPVGRYILFAEIQMFSTTVPSTPWSPSLNSVNSCELKGWRENAGVTSEVVLDLTSDTFTFPGYGRIALFAAHEVTTSGEVKVVCRQGGVAGGYIGYRVLTAVKGDFGP